jgi:hypothetical protein
VRLNVLMSSVFALAMAAACGKGAEPIGPDAAAAPSAATTDAPAPVSVDLMAGRTALTKSSETLAGFITGVTADTAGYHPSVNFLPGEAWGSYTSEGDPATGDAKVTFAVPEGVESVGLPVAVGPGLADAEIRVVAADGAEIAKWAPAEEYKVWAVWTVPVPKGTTSITVEAKDTGSDWGEWVAFGTPFKAS